MGWGLIPEKRLNLIPKFQFRNETFLNSFLVEGFTVLRCNDPRNCIPKLEFGNEEKKKMSDEIIQEVWQTKDRIAQQFNYDINALAAELRMQQQQSGRKVVNLAEEARRPTVDHPK